MPNQTGFWHLRLRRSSVQHLSRFVLVHYSQCRKDSLHFVHWVFCPWSGPRIVHLANMRIQTQGQVYSALKPWCFCCVLRDSVWFNSTAMWRQTTAPQYKYVVLLNYSSLSHGTLGSQPHHPELNFRVFYVFVVTDALTCLLRIHLSHAVRWSGPGLLISLNEHIGIYTLCKFCLGRS